MQFCREWGTVQAIYVQVKTNQTRESTSALSRRRVCQGHVEGPGDGTNGDNL